MIPSSTSLVFSHSCNSQVISSLATRPLRYPPSISSNCDYIIGMREFALSRWEKRRANKHTCCRCYGGHGNRFVWARKSLSLSLSVGDRIPGAWTSQVCMYMPTFLDTSDSGSRKPLVRPTLGLGDQTMGNDGGVSVLAKHLVHVSPFFNGTELQRVRNCKETTSNRGRRVKIR